MSTRINTTMEDYNIKAAGEEWKEQLDNEWLKLTDREWLYE